MANDLVTIWGNILRFGRAPANGEVLAGNTLGGFTFLDVGLSIAAGPDPAAGTIVFSHPLTVEGLIESTIDGFKFPDGSTQTTAATSGPSLPLSVANGGTGRATLTSKAILLGDGTSDVEFIAPGSANQILKSNGTDWAAADQYPTQSGNALKVLQTDGSAVSWQPVGIVGKASITSGTSATCTVGTGAINISSVTQSSSTYTVTFTSAYASTNYQVFLQVVSQGTNTDKIMGNISKSVGSFTCTAYRASSGGLQAASAFDILIVGGF